jgi:hypothetical protein
MITSVNIRGTDVPLADLKKDVEAAKSKYESHTWCFTSATVEALIEAIEEQNVKLKSIIDDCR